MTRLARKCKCSGVWQQGASYDDASFDVRAVSDAIGHISTDLADGAIVFYVRVHPLFCKDLRFGEGGVEKVEKGFGVKGDALAWAVLFEVDQDEGFKTVVGWVMCVLKLLQVTQELIKGRDGRYPFVQKREIRLRKVLLSLLGIVADAEVVELLHEIRVNCGDSVCAMGDGGFVDRFCACVDGGGVVMSVFYKE